MKKMTAADAAVVMITFLNSANNYKKRKTDNIQEVLRDEY